MQTFLFRLKNPVILTLLAKAPDSSQILIICEQMNRSIIDLFSKKPELPFTEIAQQT